MAAGVVGVQDGLIDGRRVGARGNVDALEVAGNAAGQVVDAAAGALGVVGAAKAADASAVVGVALVYRELDTLFARTAKRGATCSSTSGTACSESFAAAATKS